MKITQSNVSIIYAGQDKAVIKELKRIASLSSSILLEEYSEYEWEEWEDYITIQLKAVGDYDIEHDSIGHYEYHGAIGNDIQPNYMSVTSEVLVPEVLPKTIGLLFTILLEDSSNLFNFLTEDLPTEDAEGEEWEIRVTDKVDEDQDKCVDVQVQLTYTSNTEGE